MGEILWTRPHNSPDANDDDQLLAVDIADDGDIVVGGYEARPDVGEGENIFVARYDSNGNQLWIHREDGPASGDDFVEGVAIDAAGNAIVVGRVAMGDVGDTAAWVRKLDPAGKVLWTATEDLSSGNDGALGVTTFPDGRIIVVGHIDATEQGEDTNIWIRIYAP